MKTFRKKLLAERLQNVLEQFKAPHQKRQHHENRKGKDKFPKLQPFRGEKLVHIDLKGAPPLVPFFQEFFPYIRKLGATGILMEYEDMFFYRDELECIRAKNAYEPAALKIILKLAEENNLTVVPLVETFGHLEFVLKLEEFKDLREVERFPEVICPTNEKSLPLLTKMIDQILEFHPDAKYIHIGGYEVNYLGRCDKCKHILTQNKWAVPDLYLHHMKEISLYINRTYQNIRPIIWGDMVARYRKTVILKSEITTVADVMIWTYKPNVTDYLTNKQLRIIARVFKKIWIASAFKGATGVNQKTTDVSYYLKNHISWMGVANKWKRSISFKGIVITGFQRASHFEELCELLPVGIPSLTVNLIYLNGTDITKNNESVNIINCEHLPSFPTYSYGSFEIPPECNFPGFWVYRLIHEFENLYKRLQKYDNLVKDGHFTLYNIGRKYASPSIVENLFKKRPVDEDLEEIRFLEEDLRAALLEIYDEYTVQEWLDLYVTPSRLKMEALSYLRELALEQDAWPTRPLEKKKYNLEKFAKSICSPTNKAGCAALLI